NSRTLDARWRTLVVLVLLFGAGVVATALVLHRAWLEAHRVERVMLSLRASEARFRQFAENSDDVIWVGAVAGRGLEYVSPAYEKVWGRSCASLYEHPREWLEAIHPEDRPRVARSIEVNGPAGTYDEEYRVVAGDGAVRWVRDRGFPLPHEPG